MVKFIRFWDYSHFSSIVSETHTHEHVVLLITFISHMLSVLRSVIKGISGRRPRRRPVCECSAVRSDGAPARVTQQPANLPPSVVTGEKSICGRSAAFVCTLACLNPHHSSGLACNTHTPTHDPSGSILSVCKFIRH